ncbi:MAG: hypothetical protein EXR72_20580 [Myxococcales bacterium]|nr:hypothetical protein [Myxococcales bacterium]
MIPPTTRHRTATNAGAAAVFGLIGLLAPVRPALADAAVPVAALAHSAWRTRCAARLERARVELARSEPLARGAKVQELAFLARADDHTRREESVVLKMESATGKPGLYAHVWFSPLQNEPAGIWQTTAQDEGNDGLLFGQLRSVGPLTGSIGTFRATRAQVKRLVALFRPAVDECLADTATEPPLPSGRYRIDGAATDDDCAGQVVLAARHIDFAAGTLHADVVDRTYRVQPAVEGAFTATGTFSGSPLCPGTQMFERWRLAPDGENALRGTLESTWHLPPDCGRTCTVRFQVRATRP